MTIKELHKQGNVSRDDIQKMAVLFQKEHGNVAFFWATGVSKTLTALKCLSGDSLVIVSQVVHIDNWQREIDKWGITVNVDFSTYDSLHKVIKVYDYIVLDEADVITELRLEKLKQISTTYYILLTGTLKFEKELLLKQLCSYKTWKITLNDAIKMGILPSPEIHAVRIELDNKELKYVWKYPWGESKLTEVKYLEELEKKIEYYKKKANLEGWEGFSGLSCKRLGLERKQFFEKVKLKKLKELYNEHRDKRVLIFAGDIASAKLFPNSVHSQQSKQETQDIIDRFNSGELRVISNVGKLIRGLNLSDCEVSLIGSITSDGIKLIQSIGRSLRYEKPLIFIPYVSETKDFQNLDKFLKTYKGDIVWK